MCCVNYTSFLKKIMINVSCKANDHTCKGDLKMKKNELKNRLVETCKMDLKSCSYEELYTALLKITEEESAKKVQKVEGRKLYYISAEFLIGKLLSNNLINLGLYDDVKKLLEENGKSMAMLEETEPEPSLGNGGLGRLAACFLDSLATLNLPGDGIGLL